jgi:4'-phosphopantetheinyl transferase
MESSTGTRRRIRLWWTSVASAVGHFDRLIECLDADERDRANRFRVDTARHRFLAAHIMLRCTLGQHLARPPGRLRFRTSTRGKPSLEQAGDGPTPHFNLSHSGDIAVVAVAPSELGVDVEEVRPRINATRLAERFFSKSERDWLASRPPERRDADFLAIWTGKEAYLKAVGSGVAMPLRSVEIDPDRPAIDRLSNDPHAAALWSILRVDGLRDAVCSVAVRGHDWSLEVHPFRWDDHWPLTNAGLTPAV